MAPPARPEIVIGLDVGKSSHWACVVTREGELLASKPVLNRENAIDGLYAQYPGALVVVDQVRNIGSLALSRARLAGMPRAYLPGLAAHGIRAGHIHRHSRLRGPRQARLALRARAAQQAVRHVDTVGVRVAAGQQEAEEPARILWQLPFAQPQPMGRILRALPRQGHTARQGAESGGEEAARGDLRDHGGQGSIRSLTAGGDRRPGRACVSIAKNAHRKGESLLTELQEHPPREREGAQARRAPSARTPVRARLPLPEAKGPRLPRRDG